MKFTRILGVAAAVLAATAVAQTATPTTSAPAPALAVPATGAPATAAPVTGSPAAITPAPDAQPAPTTALAESGPATWGDAKAGEAKAGACGACHAADGNSTDPQYPKLAGQHETYIARQLVLFKGGERPTTVMQAMAAPLSEQDMRDIGAYFATKRAAAGVADETAIAAGANQGLAFYRVGERLWRGGKREAGIPACQACHGPTGRGIPGPTYPSVGGQHAAYTAAQLKFFRDGGAWGKDARTNTVMSTIARNLSDEEIQGLATFLEGLHAAPAVAEAP